MASFGNLQRSLHNDLSERVLLLHGYSGWPCSRGSYALCEVELSADGDGAIGGGKEVQFVVEAIPGQFSGAPVSGLGGNTREVDVVLATQNSWHGDESGLDRNLKSYGEDADSLNVIKQKETDNEVESKSEPLLPPVRSEAVNRTLLQVGKSKVVSGHDGLSTLAMLAILAPDVRICSASYENLVAIVNPMQDRASESNEHYKSLTGPNSYVGALEKDAGSKYTKSRDYQTGDDGNGASFGGRVGHPNLVPISGLLQGEDYLYVVYPAVAFTLQSLLHFSPGALGSDQNIRFLVFQVLAAVAYSHEQGLVHTSLRPGNVLVTNDLWCQITGFLQSVKRTDETLISEATSSHVVHKAKDSSSSPTESHPELCLAGFFSDWREIIRRWWAGDVSNYDYLLLLNKLAGRRWGDLCFHTVMPWVIDFSAHPTQTPPIGWRDLTKSKWRLAKGDEQLDFTYSSAEMPHHVSDECLSELAVCIYKARRLPLLVLRRVVRSVYEPNEYPVNMQRLYQWTPDECIPEFYSDPHIFESIHPGMSNLAVPLWAEGAKDFISLHRAALESKRVSGQLHHWIDLTFGYKLSGEAAVRAKNVTLSTVGLTVPRSSGRRQLFSRPHPRRQHCKSNDVVEKVQGSIAQTTSRQLSGDPYEVQQELGTAKESRSMSVQTSKMGLLSLSQDHNVLRMEPLDSLQALEDLTSFAESARHLSPCYRVPLGYDADANANEMQTNERGSESLANLAVLPPLMRLDAEKRKFSPCNVGVLVSLLEDSTMYKTLVESLDDKDGYGGDLCESLCGMQKHARRRKLSLSQGESEDIRAVGCLIAELYLRRPLFDHTTAGAYIAQGTLPDLVERLPPSVQSLVESTLQRDDSRLPSAADLLGSRFFLSTSRPMYFFLAPMHLLCNKEERLQYVTRMARAGALLSMGHAAAEMCASSILSLVCPPDHDVDVFAVITIITKLLQALKPHTSKQLLAPVLQKLLQSQDCGPLKVALLQISFIKEVWTVLGTSVYLQHIHLPIIGSLRRASTRSEATAASKVIVSMCLNIGVPITLHQTVVPLLQSFGRDITGEHVDVLVGIGERMGETLVVKHLLPPIRSIVEVNADLLASEGPGPVHSWRVFAMIDAMVVLNRLRGILRPGVLLRELLQDSNNVYMKVLLQGKLNSNLVQCAAKALLLVCNHVGAEAVVSYVLPQLKHLFEGLAFAGKLESGIENGKSFLKSRTSTKTFSSSSSSVGEESLQYFSGQDRPQMFVTSAYRSGGSSATNVAEAVNVDDDILLVHTLYPALASLVGIERLRQGLTTWLLLEQALLKHCNWKWEGSEANKLKNSEQISSTESVNPANLLLDGVGWSTPLFQNGKWGKAPSSRRISDIGSEKLRGVSEYDIGEDDGSWSWVVSKGMLWDAESFGRVGAFGLAKDDHAWGLSGTILHSWKAHHGSIRSALLDEDENTVYTAGGGARGGSVVREWRLATQDCVTEYSGHEETVTSICIIPGRGRLASCDGTIHIWNAHSGKRVALFDESPSSQTSSSLSNLSPGASMLNVIPGGTVTIPGDVHTGNGGSLSNHSLTTNLTGGGLYSCMHSLEAEERLLGGMVNGSLRFIDIDAGRQLYAWRTFGQTESSLSSFVSAIASSGQGESMEGRKYSTRSSWIAVGFGSGRCQLMDYNSGTVVSQWRAHNGFITELSAVEEHYLVSSSLDKTISLWDLRKGSSPERLQVFRGHKSGITSFALKGCDLLSASGNKIGLSNLSKSAKQGEERQLIQPQKLYSADRGFRSVSNISTIRVLPFSKLFLIGTDDGYLKICS